MKDPQGGAGAELGSFQDLLPQHVQVQEAPHVG